MVGYLTTNANGEFSGTVSGLSAGNKRLEVTFEGDSEYNQSMIARNFIIIDPTINLSLTNPLTIIEIGDTAIITANLTKNSLPFVNQEIEYEISDGSTIIDSGSDFTNNAGQITISYTGTGAGDIQITATYNNLEETISIEDCIDYQPMVSNVHQSRWTIPSQVTSSSIFGYSSDGWKYGNASSYSIMYCNTSLPSYPFSIEFTVHSKNYLAPNILIENGNGDYMGFVQYGDGMISYLQGGAGMSTGNLYYSNFSNSKIRLEITSSSFKTYVDDVLIDTRSHNFSNTNSRVRMDTGSNRWAVIKDFKIKALKVP